MALVNCPECGKEVSDKAANCISCGCPMSVSNQNVLGEITTTDDALHITIHGTVFDLNRLLMSSGDDIGKATKALVKHTGIPKAEARKYIYAAVDAMPDFDKKELKARKRMGKNSLQISDTLMTTKQETAWQRMVREAKDGQARCPRCRSTSLSANKKGFGTGKAVLGVVTFGIFGAIAGNIGAKKVRVTCLKCGKQFWAGKR